MVQINPKSGQHMAQALLDPDGVYDFVRGRLIGEDLNNFAPSIGLAWDPFGDAKTVFGPATGSPTSTTRRSVLLMVAESVRRVRIGQSQQSHHHHCAGLPAIQAPEFELPLPLATIAARNASGKGTFGIPNDLVLPYVQTWNASIGRELFWDMAIEARYVGTKGPNCSVEST